MKSFLIIDDHPLVGASTAFSIKDHFKESIVKYVTTWEKAIIELNAARFEIIILDISLPEKDGFEIFKHIKETYPKQKVIVHTMHRFPKYLEHFYNEGAEGYLLKSGELGNLNEAISTVLKGEKYFPEKIVNLTKLNPEERALEENQIQFTEKEMKVLKNLKLGLANNEICNILGIHMVELLETRKNMIYKTDSKNTQELLRLAEFLNLI